jgi:NADH:ubiquinone oxidoreductase subunit F (NADH-binding)/(2Fe-2S) ferredoxin/ferredoxin
MSPVRFKSIKEVEEYQTSLQLLSDSRRLVSISAASCGRASGALQIASALEKSLKEYGLTDKVILKLTGCHGFCQFEPNVIIFPERFFYPNLRPEQIPQIVEETLLKGKMIPELAFKDRADKKIYLTVDELPFYRKQVRWLLDAHLDLDPTSLDDYLHHDGFKALTLVLTGAIPEEIINLISASGLRGRGGAGFSTGVKWRLARQASADQKYLICNGDEGDPGAYMDRGLLESNPFSVLEGMIIGGYAIGAEKGFVYIRQEYPLAIERMEQAIDQLRAAGFIGKNILGSGFSFELELVRGAGAFVSGEETALIASIEGRRAFPRQRPPFPVVRGLWDKPTVINNVETWANIPLIIRQGPGWFSRVGTEQSKGTKIFSLVGQVRYTGLVEVPLGITLGEVIYGVGGGLKEGKKIKAVQTGGPSGGCLPASLLNLPVDYESLNQAGSIMGSGGMIVMDEGTCLVDLTLYFLNFASQESCGQCAPCRVGTRQMVRILKKISSGEGELSDLDRLEKLGWTMQKGSLCGLGRTAANPVLSALRYFREEFEAHIVAKECPAMVCKKLIAYEIDPEKCSACELCVKACPYGAIESKTDKIPVINQELCTRCGVCFSTCPPRFSAIRKVSRKSLRQNQNRKSGGN